MVKVVVDPPSSNSPKKNMCTHPGLIHGMCICCGQIMNDEAGVAFGYIHKNLRLSNDEISGLRDKNLKNLLHHKKLHLVLDLDHTLLNSTCITANQEGYLKSQEDTLPDNLKSSLFTVESMQMMTKLRPFVTTFLKEASKLFEMYIYTMGKRSYALEMAKLLDPEDIYFHSRVIAKEDCTQRDQKGLDVVLGERKCHLESVIVSYSVWKKHKRNLILMERYNFFAESCEEFRLNSKSLPVLRCDESETDGALATVLKVLQRIHSYSLARYGKTRHTLLQLNLDYFQCTDKYLLSQEHGDNLECQDVRQILKSVRAEVLKGCKVIFDSVPKDEHLRLWKMARKLGARCTTNIFSVVTHVVSIDAQTYQSSQAIYKNKFLVDPRWIEASSYLWQKQPEENFPVSRANTNIPFMLPVTFHASNLISSSISSSS
ncbi:RNA polymerase II C-terminal domain phosphatase-like 4 [Abeliophyllum distichum]|uniref:RNA polymerase II C-terminal domain phosphatase-like n=1 Tax=Abeliophyllum distichum TaxID=126358 RepID=A0ABD1TGS8_9LAMI